MRRRDGFTLIELLIVVVVIAILASFAILRFHAVQDRAAWAMLEADLRALSIQQELYHAGHERYTTDKLAAEYVESGPQSTVTITFADNAGWAAYAVHLGLPGHRCALFYGSAPAESPATAAGVITCDR